MKNITLQLFLGALLLLVTMVTGCSKEKPQDNGRLPDGKYPINFSTKVEVKTTTRATSDNSWTQGEEVAIQIGDAVKMYTVAANDGSLTSVDPFYWYSSTKIETVSAWYPYNNGVMPTTFTVEANQSEAGYQQSDLIYVNSQDIKFKNSILSFKHLPTKLVINLKNDNHITQGDIADATVSIVNQTLTSGAISEEWGVTQVSKGNNEITVNTLTTPTNGYQKTVQALLVPQTSTEVGPFIRVRAAGLDYYYSTKLDFAAGSQYTYNITVTKSGLVVTESGETGWTSSGEIIEEDSHYIFSATDIKAGDYYYSDGTWSDGGLRKLRQFGHDDDYEIEAVYPDDNKEVIGIVYWAGDATRRDPTLKANHPTCTHGLVLAMWGDQETAWQSSPSSIQGWLDYNAKGRFLPVQSGTGPEDPLNNIQGYNNTKAIEEFNKSNPNSIVAAVDKVVAFRQTQPAPSSSSDWYLPSVKELTLMYGTGIHDIWENNSGGSVNREIINSRFILIGGDRLLYNYWASSEDVDFTYAFTTHFFNGEVNADPKTFARHRMRISLAF